MRIDMIPGKIFIDEDLIAYHCLTDRHDGDLEYLSKDTLMEWAKEQKARLKQGYKKDWKNDDTINGGRLMLDKLINKLISM